MIHGHEAQSGEAAEGPQGRAQAPDVFHEQVRLLPVLHLLTR